MNHSQYQLFYSHPHQIMCKRAHQLSWTRSQADDAWFWATHQGAEIDLLVQKNGQILGVECKRTDAPRMTSSIRIALTDLKLDRVIVVYPGDRRFSLADQVEAMPLKDITTDESLGGLIG
jgi:predicted AAA+ superfamily ATPase